jgi:hypothetical protein
MATQFSENGIFCRKFPVYGKKNRQKATENWFFRDGVAAFMPTGYSFQTFLKSIRQLSRNLPRDARHSGYIRKLRKKTLVAHVSPQWSLTKMGSYHVPYFVNAHFFFSMMAWR